MYSINFNFLCLYRYVECAIATDYWPYCWCFPCCCLLDRQTNFNWIESRYSISISQCGAQKRLESVLTFIHTWARVLQLLEWGRLCIFLCWITSLRCTHIEKWRNKSKNNSKGSNSLTLVWAVEPLEVPLTLTLDSYVKCWFMTNMSVEFTFAGIFAL